MDKQVYLSDYLKSRRFNEKLYNKLIGAIEKNLKTELKTDQGLEIVLSMSAKFQTPCIIIKSGGNIPKNIEHLEKKILTLLDEIGFGIYNEGTDHGSYYVIDFKD